MAEAGRPGISSIDATGMRVGIVAAQWNAELCNQMLSRACAVAEEAGATVDVSRPVLLNCLLLPNNLPERMMLLWQLESSFVVILHISIMCVSLSPMVLHG